MKHADFVASIAAGNIDRLTLLTEKGKAYSNESDVFANFKKNGEKLGLTKYQIWAVYCGKHLDSIFNAIRHDAVMPKDSSEGMSGRIDDAINYLQLLEGMLKEDGLL